MKLGKLLSLKVIVVAALLAFANQSHALYTNFLNDVVVLLGTDYNALTNNPTPTPAEKKAIKAIAKAYKALSKPSDSVLGDYNLFLAAASALGPLINDPMVNAAGSNAGNLFISEATAEYVTTAGRVAALNNFVHQKRSASNDLYQAYTALISLPTTTNQQKALLIGRVSFIKIGLANKLAATGEAHAGFAPDSVSGDTLTYHVAGRNGSEHFTDDSHTDSVDLNGGTTFGNGYTYTRTGLSTATLMLDYGGGNTTSVKAKFTSTSHGTFTFHSEDNGQSHSGPGTFDLTF